VPSFTLSRRRAIATLGAAFSAIFVVAHFFVSTPPAPTPTVQRARLPVTPAPPPPAQQVVVDVAGAVLRPGVYRLPRGSRVADAIERAGGTTRRAEASLVNRAAPVADGQQVLVPARGVPAPASAAPGPGTPRGASTAPIDLNTATAEQLETLPGVGPVTAQKIVAYRQTHGPFTSVDQLDAIRGIGPARIADLRGLVRP
jgi:competence protein ComEA